MPKEEFTGLSPSMQALASRRQAENVERTIAKAMRTEEILKDVALAFTGSDMFSDLRKSYAEADPVFRAKMEGMLHD